MAVELYMFSVFMENRQQYAWWLGYHSGVEQLADDELETQTRWIRAMLIYNKWPPWNDILLLLRSRKQQFVSWISKRWRKIQEHAMTTNRSSGIGARGPIRVIVGLKLKWRTTGEEKAMKLGGFEVAKYVLGSKGECICWSGHKLT